MAAGFVSLIMVALVATALVFSFPSAVHADCYVNGYYRSNGTYVNGYYRTCPDSNPYNNYSYPGNYNPHTGETATGNPSTYLNNYSSGGSSYTSPSSIYTSPSVSCPINSYYDGLSSCKCNYGYVVSGSSCVSANSLCYDQVGYSSGYDSLTGNCKCNSGYVLDGGKCKSATLVCSNELGIMSQYNSLTKTCECMAGYEFDGINCSYKKTSYPAASYASYSASSYASTASTCPVNSHESSSDVTKCDCDTGFMVNPAKTACIPIPPAAPVVATPAATPTTDAAKAQLIALLQEQLKLLLAQLLALKTQEI